MPPFPMKTTFTNAGEASSPSSQKNNVHNRAGNDGNDNDVNNKNNNNNIGKTNNKVVDDDEALGSGMATFFSDFVPYQSDTNDKPIRFSTGLSRLPAVPTKPIENANHIEASIGIKYIDGGLLYNQWRNKEKEYLTDYLMLRLHPHPDEEITQQSGDNSTLSSSESSYDEGDGEEEAEPESELAMETQEPLIAETLRLPDEEEVEPESQLAMETQEPLVVAETLRLPDQGKSSCRKRKKRSRRNNTIPYVEDCLHDMTKLEFLDLHARTLSLNLSRIDKVWKLRNTKRSGATLAKRSIRKPVFESSSCSPPSRSRRAPQQQLPQRLIFEEKEEDGPVAAIYKTVVHFEVEQLHVAQHTGGPGGVVGGPNDLLLSPSSNNKRRSNGGKQFQQRIKVFFYNSYATAVSEWIKEQQKESGKKRKHDNSTDSSHTNTDIVMNLSNIPAACIFPYAVDPRNWREKQDLVDYCLCIGDTSIVTTRKSQELEHHGNNNENQIRFDSKEMEIRLMSVVTRTTASRTRTTAGSIVVTTAVVDDVDVSSELILSRRTLAKDFLSSSEENTPQVVEGGGEEEKELQKLSDDLTIPLQKSWETYKKNQDQGPNNNNNPALPNQGDVATNRQSASLLNERPPLQGRSPTNRQQYKEPRRDGDEPVVVEPMMFEGVTQRRSDSKDMNYVRLGEIANMVNQSIGGGRGCNFKVNLYASVVGVTPPRITKRGDWMIAATLIDESCLTPLTINIFCKKQEQLPKLIWMGDVIRIHRAALEKWYDKIQIQGLKPTQYAVIRKSSGRNWQVIPTAQNHFTFNRSDEERSQALWRWANKHAEKSPSMKAEHCFTLDELQHLKKEDDETTFENKDITVMVVQKLRYQYSDVLPHGVLRVWDGTGNAPSDPLFMQAKLLNPPPEEQRAAAYPRAIEKVIRTSQQLQASMDTMEIPISLCGRVSNVVVWEKSHWALIHEHIPVGTFLRLRNVHIPQRWEANNFRSIFMHDKSWMTALPTNNFEVRSLLYQHNERIVRRGRNNSNNAYNPEFGGGCPSSALVPHLPTCKFVGTGLSRFKNQEKLKVYTGAVYINASSSQQQPTPTNNDNTPKSAAMKTMTIADRSGSFQAMVTKKVRDELQNLLPPEDASSVSSTAPTSTSDKALDSNRRFLITIRMILLDGDYERKFFVLTNLAPMD